MDLTKYKLEDLLLVGIRSETRSLGQGGEKASRSS